MMNFTKIDINLLKENPDNPRTIIEDKFQALIKSVKEFPQMLELRPIVLKSALDLTVLGGNMRLRAAKAAGFTELPVLFADALTPEQQREFIIKDNVGFGEWEWEKIITDWPEAPEWGLDIPTWINKKEAVEDDYEIPDEIETDIVLGDLFEIGQHRLLCGDSTKVEDVKKVLSGKEPYLMVTDPPYGVNYDASWRDGYDLNIGKKIGGHYSGRAIGKVNNDDQSDWTQTWVLFPGHVIYCWHGGVHSNKIANNLNDAGFVLRSQIIWVKQHFVFGRGDYHWQHEPCWYAVKKGSKGNWAGDRKQTTVWNINNNNPFGTGNNKEEKTGHSTQKPVECMARPISHHDGDVYDPFLGSGTTMVAAHQLNRKCYGIEIDPKYCKVIIDRMLKLDPSLAIKKNGLPLNNASNGKLDTIA